MPNAGVNYRDGILICAHGTLDSPDGLSLMESSPSVQVGLSSHVLLGQPPLQLAQRRGRACRRLRLVHPSHPRIGARDPRLPSQVYRFDPGTGSIRVVADGFGRPNGTSFSPDQTVVYITDTDRIHGEREVDDTRVSTMQDLPL
ncbi:hypothetical protein E4U43_002481 [Claviceps pusilla]|uniref:SMP-30/Gluconolactonase/LRE-like region domain-containing protein n=1 Tax=Claviceps pusilla TaxID=123648 RepID=A0A9P7N710_9HYPO|nr:hypothetical protein E4U43_002481 [Claviceps pusilla]